MGGKGSGNREGWRNAPHNRMPRNQDQAVDMFEDLFAMPSVDLSDADAVRDRAFEYMELCRRHRSKVLISGMCMALGTTRPEVLAWSHGSRTSLDERFFICSWLSKI